MGTFRNPFMLHAPDPFLVIEDGYYYLTASSQDRIRITRSKRLSDFWQKGEQKEIWHATPGRENGTAIWAPEIHKLDGKWWAYYAATDGPAENRRMFVLEHHGDSLWDGHWTEKGRLAAATDYWAIDGTVLKYGGELYFVWSGWAKPAWRDDEEEIQDIYIAKMSNPYTIDGERVRLSTPDREWERRTSKELPLLRVNEGPIALYTDTYTYIIYSASFCGTEHYCYGGLRLENGKDPMVAANWHKFDEPLFQKSDNNRVYGVGHNSFLKSPDGTEWWNIYHAYDSDPPYNGYNRHAFAQKFTIDEQDHPHFGEPLPIGTDIPAPSGEDTW